jgi:hypothetical protein
MHASLRAGTVATAVFFFTGCVDRYTIPTIQLQYLNGYDIHGEQTVNGATITDRPYRLVSAKGEVVDYNSTKKLVLFGDGGTPLTPPGPYSVIFINEGTFDAVPLQGSGVAVPLDSVSAAQLTQSSPEKTAELFGVIGLVIAVVSLGVTIATVAQGQQSTQCCGLRTQNAALK